MKVRSQIGPFSIVPEWVMDRGLSATGLKLYVTLGRFADYDSGVAFPSRETLAARMSCSEKTVDRAVTELEEAECIEVWAVSRYASKRYRVLQVDPRGLREGTFLSDEETDLSGEETNLSVRKDTDVHLTRTNEREPLERESKNEAFSVFWFLYPRRVGKTAAKKAFDKAVDSVGLETVLDGVKRFASDPYLPETKFIPHPSTWLNEGRWDDDPYPAPTFDVKPTAAQRTASLYAKYKAIEDAEEQEIKGIGQGPDFGDTLRSID